MIRKIIGIAALFLSLTSPAMAEGGKVVVSIKPLYGLVAAVMEGDTNQPVVLVDGKQSLHNFSLKPSQVKALSNADIVFYIDGHFEMFMDKTLDSLNAKTQRVELSKLVGIPKLPIRVGNGFYAHDEHDAKSNQSLPYDFHIWMSPVNAKQMVLEIARQLAIIYPDKREIYFANVRAISEKLDALNDDLEQRMAPLQSKPFVVFHDAYQYFDSIYGLRVIGALSLHPEHGVSAKNLSDLRAKIKSSGAICVFREPQFDGKVVNNLLEGTSVKTGVLDPEAGTIAPGPNLYFEMMEQIASGLEKCLQS